MSQQTTAELVHQFAEVSGAGRTQFHYDSEIYGEWFMEDDRDPTDDAVERGVMAITTAASWCRGRPGEAFLGATNRGYVIDSAEMYKGKVRRLLGAGHVTIQFNFAKVKGTRGALSICVTPCALFRFDRFWCFVREAIATSALLGTSRVSGANSSIQRFVRHPLYERCLWWRIFQFMGLATVQ